MAVTMQRDKGIRCDNVVIIIFEKDISETFLYKNFMSDSKQVRCNLCLFDFFWRVWI